jgi:hypothetical protein
MKYYNWLLRNRQVSVLMLAVNWNGRMLPHTQIMTREYLPFVWPNFVVQCLGCVFFIWKVPVSKPGAGYTHCGFSQCLQVKLGSTWCYAMCFLPRSLQLIIH